MSSLEVELRCASLGDCTVLELSGHEAMDSLSSWRARVRVAEHIDASAALRADAVLALLDPLEGTERWIRLLVTEIAGEIDRGRDRVLELHLTDPPWLLLRRGGYRIFQEKTTEQIVGEVLKGAGIPAAALVPRLSDSYPVRLQCVQYAESEWAFLERLLADDGISYWFDTTAGGEHRIFLGDSAGAHDGIDGGATLPHVGPTGAMRAGKRGFSSLEWEERVVTDRVQIRDFDVRHPDVYIEGESGTGSLGYFE